MILARNFAADFAAVKAAFAARERFAFVRFGTGEQAVIEGRPVLRTASGWHWPGGDTAYHREMKAAWEYGGLDPGWFVGMSCPCCNPYEFRFYAKTNRTPLDHLTFATLFMGSNWPAARQWAKELVARREVILVGPLLGSITVPKNVMEPQEFDYEKVLAAMLESEKPMLLAAGPLAKILAWRYWTWPGSPRQTVIDIGSTLDIEMFGAPTRHYMRQKICKAKKTRRELKKQRIVNTLVGRTCIWKLARHGVHKGMKS